MWFLWLLLDAAVLGVIIAAMEDGEFHDWWRMIVCALGTAAATRAMGMALGPIAGPLGVWVSLFFGALAGGLLISWLCGMSVKRASIAAAIYLAYKVVLQLVVMSLFSK